MKFVCILCVSCYNNYMQPAGQKGKNFISKLVSSLLTIFCVLLSLLSICFAVFNLYYKKTRVRGYSMRPTINSNVSNMEQDGDYVFINTHASLKRDTVVVAYVSWWKKGSIIKRLVGMPGDCVQIVDNSATYDLCVNGELIYSKAKQDQNGNINLNVKNYYERKYLKFISNSTISNSGENIDHTLNIGSFNGKPCIKLNEGEYFLVGDNWTDTMVDSMTHGPVDKQSIVGVVEYIIDVNDNYVWECLKQIFKILFTV